MKLRTLLFLVFFGQLAFSQGPDSLIRLLSGQVHDTTRLRLLLEISEQCDEQEIFKYTLPAISLADKLLASGEFSGSAREKILNRKGYAHINTGYLYDKQGKAKEALDQYRLAIKIFLETGDKMGIANGVNNMGTIFDSQGDILRALNCYEIALSLYEALSIKEGMAYTLNNIGAIYEAQGHTTQALEYYQRCLKINEEAGDKRGSALSLNNIGLIYYHQGKTKEALQLYERGLKLQQELNDVWGTSLLLNNMALCYYAQHDIPRSLEYHFKSLRQKEEISDLAGVSSSMNNIATLYHVLNMNNKARVYSDSALKIAVKLGYPEHISNAARTLSRIDSSLGDMTGAFVHYKQYIQYRDSINNAQTRKASTRNQLKYEFEKKEAVLKEQQEKERVLARAQSRAQQIIIWCVAGGLALVLCFAIFVFRSLKTTRRQKQIIEEKQREILDSIHYARRIQRSLLPTEKYIARSLAKKRGEPT